MSNGYVYRGERSRKIDDLEEQIPDNASERSLGSYTRQEHQIRGVILQTPISMLEEVLESHTYLERNEAVEDHFGALEEREADGDDDFDEEAEGYDTPSDVDGDPSEPEPELSDFDRVIIRDVGEADESWWRHYRHLCVLVLEERADGTLTCHTPGDSIIQQYTLHPGFADLPRDRWLAQIVLNALEERQRHLHQMGDLLCRLINCQRVFFTASTLEEALAHLEEFTPVEVSTYLGVRDETMSRLRHSTTIRLPRFGDVRLDAVFDMTKKAPYQRLLEVIRSENPEKPFTRDAIAAKLRKSSERVGQILRDMGIPSRFGVRRQAYRKGEAWWIQPLP